MGKKYNVKRGHYPCARCGRVLALKTSKISHEKHCGQRVLRRGEYYDEQGRIRRHKPGTYYDAPRYSRATVSRRAERARRDGADQDTVRRILEESWGQRRKPDARAREPVPSMARLPGETNGQWRERLSDLMARSLRGEYDWNRATNIYEQEHQANLEAERRQRAAERRAWWDKQRAEMRAKKRHLRLLKKRMLAWKAMAPDYVRATLNKKYSDAYWEHKEKTERKLANKRRLQRRWFAVRA